MSNRTLIELDHDKCHTIKTNAEAFTKALVAHMRNPSEASRLHLWLEYGVTVFGQPRHHASPYHIQWGHSQRFDYPEINYRRSGVTHG